MGSYCGSKSRSMSTPSLLLGRSMMWPLDASTMKSLPRNLLSVLDLVGDSTTTRFLPFALPARLASISASSTTGSAAVAGARPPAARARAVWLPAAISPRRDGGRAGFAGFAGPSAALAAGLPGAAGRVVARALPGFFFSVAAGAATASVRDFLVAMRVLPPAGVAFGLERHARRHLVRPLHGHGSLVERRERLQH